MAIIRRMAMARYRPDAFPCCRPWQDIAPMRSRAAGHGKISPRCVPEGASDGKSTGSWQHIACMYSNTANFGKICVPCIRKSPAERRWGIHRANILPPSDGLAPAQGLLPEQPYHGIAFQRLGPCSGGCLPRRPANTRQYPPPANACRLPMPAACRARCSQRQAADGLRRRSFGAWHIVWPSPEGPPTASS